VRKNAVRRDPRLGIDILGGLQDCYGPRIGIVPVSSPLIGFLLGPERTVELKAIHGIAHNHEVFLGHGDFSLKGQ
jgi:hypothetical protein